MKTYLCAAVALVLAIPTSALADNYRNGLAPVPQGYTAESSLSPTARQYRHQGVMLNPNLPPTIHSKAVGPPGDGVSQGAFYGVNPNQRVARPVQGMQPSPVIHGLPNTKTSKYLGTPGEDARRNTIKTASEAWKRQQAQRTFQLQQQQQQPQRPAEAYTYTGGYTYK